MKSNSEDVFAITKLQGKQFNKILFDMDGVITSEALYWDTAALTVYELLFDRQDCKVEDVSQIHDTIFSGRDFINALKVRGVNTNWDLALIAYCLSKHLKSDLQELDNEHFQKMLDFANSLPNTAAEVYDISYNLAAKATGKDYSYFVREKGEFWTKLQKVFAYWFVDKELYKTERPVVPLDQMQTLFKNMFDCGIKLGVGTGRPNSELQRPLDMWDIAKYFDEESVIGYTDIINAEKTCGNGVSLAKPHPYVFLKGAAGKRYTDQQLLDGTHDNITEGVLVVGDAVADFVSAKDGGFAFAAVLTGVSGNDMRGYFEQNGADYIFDDVLGLADLL